MSVLTIVLIVVGAVLLLLFLGGLAASIRNRRAGARHLAEEIAAVNAALADARAKDRGWDRELIEAAARKAYAARHDGAEPVELRLVQVVDRPGTDADLAVFRARGEDGRDETISLGRRDGAWVPAESL